MGAGYSWRAGHEWAAPKLCCPCQQVGTAPREELEAELGGADVAAQAEPKVGGAPGWALNMRALATTSGWQAREREL